MRPRQPKFNIDESDNPSNGWAPPDGVERAKALSKSRSDLAKAQPAPALYIIIKWNGEAAGEPYYKKSEADGVCDKFYGPVARVVEYHPVEESRHGKKKTK